MKIVLSLEQKALLEQQHRKERDGRIRDRIKAILLAAEGWTYVQIAQALRIHHETVSQHVSDFIEEEKLKPENGGSKAKLNEEQAAELIVHLEENTYTKTADICAHIQKTYGITYSIPGITNWLHANEFSYKKPKEIPHKANPEQQAAFIKKYNDMMKTVLEDEPILFMDAVHPTMATKISYGWIRTGKEKLIASTASRTRMNVVGALNLESMDLLTQEYDTINGENVIKFLKFLEIRYKDSPKIHIILDNGRYHGCQEVLDFIEQSRVKLHFLPPYSPNLNPIERVWKVMNEYVRNNRFFGSQIEFADAINGFFQSTWKEIALEMRSRINDNFQIFKSVSST